MDADSSNKPEHAAKLQQTLESREKQIGDMAEMLAELNEKLNDVCFILSFLYSFIS